MAPGRVLLSTAALASVSFGLGFFLGSRGEIEEPGLEESRLRIQRALVASDRLEQTSLLVPVLQAMGPDDVEALAQAFEASFRSGPSGLPLELFVESWARFDPQGSRARIAAWPADAARLAWPALVRSWARTDPAAARGILEEIPDPAVRRAAVSGLVEGWSGSSDPGLWSYLSELPDVPRRRELAARAVQERLSQKGAEGLLGELEALHDAAPMDRFKGEVLASAAAAVARANLARAVALAEAKRDTPYGGEILLRVATHWASQDGPAAAAWLRSQPAGDRRDRALANAYRRWWQADRKAASAWLELGIGDANLAAAVIAHASLLAQEDAAAAGAWAGGIQDPELRSRSLAAIDRVGRIRERASRRGAPRVQPGGLERPAPPALD